MRRCSTCKDIIPDEYKWNRCWDCDRIYNRENYWTDRYVQKVYKPVYIYPNIKKEDPPYWMDDSVVENIWPIPWIFKK